jgi:hypothetical protein
MVDCVCVCVCSRERECEREHTANILRNAKGKKCSVYVCVLTYITERERES